MAVGYSSAMTQRRDLTDTTALAAWQQSARGAQCLAAEQRELDRVLPGLFGRCIVQVGSWGLGRAQIDQAQMPVRLVLGTAASDGSDAVIQSDALPLAKGQADAVLLPHSLDYARSPHRLLREADRLLSPRGHLVVLGFNPLSLWGLRHLLGLPHAALPPGARFLTLRRVIDWMSLLDMDIVQLRRFGVGCPWTRPVGSRDGWSVWRALGFAHEAFVVVGRKRTVPATPIRERWAARQPDMAPAGVRVSFEAAAQRRDARD